MKLIKTAWITGFVFFILIPVTWAGNPKKISVVYTDWYPYTYQDKGKPAGFEIEIVTAVMKSMGIQVEFTNYPWKRCLNCLKEGTADALVSLLKTDEREQYTFFPNTPISISKTVFITKSDRNIKFRGSLEELKNFNIGVIMGFSYNEAFDKAVYLKKDNSLDTRILLTKLLNNRHDLAAENQTVATAYAIRMGIRDKIKFLEPPIHTERLYVGFSKAKKTKALCGDFSNSLKEFKKTKTYTQILEKYGVEMKER
jgi:polar amino acid transport system substrate-binding protein